MAAPLSSTGACAAAQVARILRFVRHATEADLDCLEDLLAELRKLPQLRERKRGYFSRGTHAFLHFHEDEGDLFVDVKLRDAFERMKVTNSGERRVFLTEVQRALQAGLH